MKKELDELTSRGREEMSERLRVAREYGDIKENAEYDVAKDAQGLMEARIRELQHMIRSAVVRGGVNSDEVVPGMIVSVKEGDETDDYLIAVSKEEKVSGVRTVTISSPLGKALVGKKPGEKAEVDAPAGKFTVEILGIRPS